MQTIQNKNPFIYGVLLTSLVATQTHTTIFNPFTWFDDTLTITDISETSIIPVAAIKKPKTITGLQNIVLSSTLPISIAGGRFSQGGQIAYPNGTVIDITRLKAIHNLDLINNTITVETGATWRDIQNYIAPYNLSIKVMQSYNDFTVGGSLSVNVHGRDIHYGPLIETIQSIEILLADGTIANASRTQYPDLFAGAIGGYGALGIITKATISLTTNTKITREVKQMPVTDYPQFFLKQVKNNPEAVFHNANLYPDDFTKVTSVTWSTTNNPLTITEQLQARKKIYPMHMLAEQILRRMPILHKIRPSIDIKIKAMPTTVGRNYEMSSTVNSLEPLVRFPTTTVLQEYFIPMDKLLSFIQQISNLTNIYDMNIVNISIRYIPQNTESVLSYARNECFSLVFYINILNTENGLEDTQKWTRKLIDSALQLGGTYYLPYQLFGTLAQVKQAYPRFDEFISLKKKYDPNNTFSNSLLKKYSY